MIPHHLLARLRLALAIAAVGSLALASVGHAQTTSTEAGSRVVRIESPAPGTQVSGNATFTGLAVDCRNRQPATRVELYDGPLAQHRHLGDASLFTVRELDDACLGQSGTAPIGWTLVLDSQWLTAGRHALTFVAHFADGETRSVTHEISVQFSSNRTLQLSGPVVWYNGGYWVNGTYMGPNYLPTVVSTSQCASYSANGACLAYHQVNTIYPALGLRGYTTCTGFPTYRCNFTATNGGAMISR